MIDLLQIGQHVTWHSLTELYAVSYQAKRTQNQPHHQQVWPESLTIGEVLPIIPLGINVDHSVPMELESPYQTVGDSLRMPVVASE